MSLDFLSVLFGQAAQSSGPFGLPAGVLTLLRVLVAIPLPLFLGQLVAKWLRMKEYGWRLGVIFTSIFCATVILQAGRLNKGVDLKGGVILVYEIDRESLQTDANTPISADKVNWGSLIQALVKRINPAGTKEIVVRRYGDWQVEIIVPEVDPIEIERIKKLIETAGSLEFRIVANERENSDVIAAAREQAQNSPARRSRIVVDKDNKHLGFWARIGREAVPQSIRPFKVSPVGHIVRNAGSGEILDLTPATRLEGDHAVEKYLEGQGIKDIDILMETNDGYDVTGAHLGMCSRGFDEMMQPSVNFAMKGEGIGKMGGLTGSVIPRGQPPFYQLLGIMLDGELLSAPRVMSTISDRGRITGRFTQPEVDFLVGILQAGSLPAAMKKSPISANQIGAVLGEEEIRKGTIATGASLIAVVLFMWYWYRFPGFIACVAMAANLIMTVAIMIPIHAPLTLPGLAGLVLTMGMAVDANVLIYERMREELDRGCALRMAIRNGFDRAWVTILDSNLTTILTALILYVVGTDQLKGFGVTLTLGLCISMFTSVFCSRVAFDICERKGIITRLRFRHLLTKTNFNFMGVRNLVFGASAVIIAVGLAAAVYRGQQIFAVDFLGGSSVTMVLENPQEERDLRATLDGKFEELKKAEGESQQYTLSRVDVAGKPRGTWWKIDSSLKEETQLQDILQSAFKVAHYQMAFDEKNLSEKRVTAPADTEKSKSAEAQPASPKPETPAKPKAEAPDQTSATPESSTTKPAEQPPAETAKPEKAKPGEAAVPETKPADEKPKESPSAEAKPTETKPAEAKPAESPAEKPKAEETKAEPPATESAKPEEKQPDSSQTELPPINVYAMIGAGDLLLALADDAETPAPAEAPAKTAPAAEKPAEQPAAEKPAEKATEPAPPKPPQERVTSTTELTFGQEIAGRGLEFRIRQAAEDQEVRIPLTAEDITLGVIPEDANWRIDDAKGYIQWRVALGVNKQDAAKILNKMKNNLTTTPVWPSSSKIGERVASDTQVLAVVALLASFVGIAIYVWVRFQHLIFGIGAVASLVHDVLITVAAVAFSYWLAGFLGFLQVEEVKIDLNIIAALLTIVGYSINDTIVVFDRVREVRGKSPELTAELFNKSLNQTLSRTILTTTTVFLVVMILYFFGGAGIHGFAYAMLIGTITGAYSTIYVASPVVLWMTPKKKPGNNPRFGR